MTQWRLNEWAGSHDLALSSEYKVWEDIFEVEKWHGCNLVHFPQDDNITGLMDLKGWYKK